MIYENIKRLCAANNTNICNLEKTLGIANGTIGKWAGGKTTPRLTTVKTIADYFGCTIDNLMQPDNSENKE